MRPRSLAVLTALALASAPFLAGAASSADTAVGETFVPTGMACAGNNTLMQTTSAAPSYAVAAAGVITSWRTTGQANATTTRALKVGRVVGTNVLITGTSDLVSVPASQTVSLPARIPVQPGDVLGVYTATLQGMNTLCSKQTSNADTFAELTGNPGPGSAAIQTPTPGFRIPVAATVEPDADGDGFGDTTQDSCPTQAGTQGACKDLVAPNTTITSAKAAKAKLAKTQKSGRKTYKKAKVTVAFAATETATFACSVDGAAYTACASPLVVKLKKGTHPIAVRATDTAGNVDTTPATTTVKVKKAKSAKKR